VWYWSRYRSESDIPEHEVLIQHVEAGLKMIMMIIKHVLAFM
jgi:hypothetical protein